MCLIYIFPTRRTMGTTPKQKGIFVSCITLIVPARSIYLVNYQVSKLKGPLDGFKQKDQPMYHDENIKTDIVDLFNISSI